jgi:CubicO group peptidase (beta-lactamase class C family)
MRRRQLIVAALPLAAGCAGPRPGAPADGIDATLQARLAAAGSDGSNTHAVLVQRGARTLAELYFSGTDRPSGSWWPRSVAFDAHTPHDQRSVTKSVLGLLAGIQHGRGVLGPLDTPVLRFFPEHSAPAGSPLQALQLQHLLDMTTGWQWDELSLPYDHPANPDNRMARATDLPAFAFGLPFDQAPGTRFTYCGVAPRLLAAVLQRASGQSLRTLADDTLFGPLGIANPPWGTGRDGSLLGDSGLRLTPRQMARIGRLMLDSGRGPQGRQVVPADWVAASHAHRVPAAFGMTYSRYWWHGRFGAGPGAGIGFTTAMGNGGQRIAVVPALDAVVVITAGRYNQPDNGVPSSRLLRTVLAHLAAGG